MGNERKGAIQWRGNPTDVVGPALKAGDRAPGEFTLLANDMSPVKGSDLQGKPRVLIAVPSLDTPVCDRETRTFNQEAAGLPGVELIVVSMDLPFAQKRWCGAAGTDRVRTLSDFRDRSFGPAYGVWVPSKGLLARAVFVIGADDVLRHVEYVSEVGNEPDYKPALEAARGVART